MGNALTTSESFSRISDDSSCSSDGAYFDEPEETTMCSPFFIRKSDPLTLLGNHDLTPTPSSPCSLHRSLSCNDRSIRSLNADGEEDVGCVSSLPSSPSWASFDDWQYTLDELEMIDGDLPTAESDLRPSPQLHRTFWVVTTAALPWMTGTAVNPLLRAAHLSRLNRPFAEGRSTVTLVVPWLESPDDRIAIYGDEWKQKTQADQDAYIRTWLAEKADLPLEANLENGGIQIQFYNARLHRGMNSIFAMGDICSSIPNELSDVCFLEEPEHLNWYRAPGKDWWTEKFRHVVGIGHTNYKAYVREQFFVMTPVVGTISSLMVRAYCHKLIKLSPVLQTYAPEKEVVCNVHGIRNEFLHARKPSTGVYFIGKLLWAKGFDRMIELQSHYRKLTGSYFPIDIAGTGPEESEIKRAFLGRLHPQKESAIPKSRYEWRKDAIPGKFLGRKDHAECQDYKIFVNPSITEVLCTTTAEAIAMGKFALVPAHPSNIFFRVFPNCLQYRNPTEFVTLLQYALSHDPEPLTESLKYELTWEAATERCLASAAISRRDAKRRARVGKSKLDNSIAKLHYELGKGVKGDVIRKVLGGGPVSDQVQYENSVRVAVC